MAILNTHKSRGSLGCIMNCLSKTKSLECALGVLLSVTLSDGRCVSALSWNREETSSDIEKVLSRSYQTASIRRNPRLEGAL